jgi:hypothetical protein
MSEDSEKQEDINFKTQQQLAKAKWQRECREREKLYLIEYNPNRFWKRSEGVCTFCTRTVYFDSHHLNAPGSIVGESKIGKWYPHDRYYKEGDPGKEVRHHVTHCKGLWGTPEEKEECRKLRQQKGMPEPKFYNKHDIATEKPDEKKKLVPPEKIITLDDMLDKEAEQEITIAPDKWKLTIEIKSDRSFIEDEVLDLLLETHPLEKIRVITEKL